MNLGSIFVSFIGGLGLFLYGMHIMADGIQKVAGSKMKSLLESLTKSKLRGVLVGTAVTTIIQSSTATTVMVIGFVNAGLMSLNQSVGVIMGANIGTTITSWIIALDEISSRVQIGAFIKYFTPSGMSPVLIALGACMVLFSKREKVKQTGGIVAGFGLLFLGIGNMTEAASPLRDWEAFREMFIRFGSNPILGVLTGAVVTAIVQSSSASVGILQSLAAIGMVPWNAAVYLIMGQNIGTCLTAVASGLGASKAAKASSYIHLLFNVTGSIIFGLLSIIFFSFINPQYGLKLIDMTGIGIVHSSFNIANTIILYPFSGFLVKIAERMAGSDDKDISEESQPVHLDDRMLNTPAFALESSIKEIIRLGDMTVSNLRLSMEALRTRNTDMAQQVFNREKNIDALEQAITSYLVKISGIHTDNESNRRVASLYHTLNDVERVGDRAENIAELAEYMLDNEVELSEFGQLGLEDISDLVIDCYEKSIRALETGDRNLARQVFRLEEKVDVMEKELRTSHLNRLTNNECNTRAGVVFLDTLTNLERISDHAENIAETVLEKV